MKEIKKEYFFVYIIFLKQERKLRMILIILVFTSFSRLLLAFIWIIFNWLTIYIFCFFGRFLILLWSRILLGRVLLTGILLVRILLRLVITVLLLSTIILLIPLIVCLLLFRCGLLSSIILGIISRRICSCWISILRIIIAFFIWSIWCLSISATRWWWWGRRISIVFCAWYLFIISSISCGVILVSRILLITYESCKVNKEKSLCIILKTNLHHLMHLDHIDRIVHSIDYIVENNHRNLPHLGNLVGFEICILLFHHNHHCCYILRVFLHYYV